MTVTGDTCPKGGQHTSNGPQRSTMRGLAMYVCDKCHRFFGVRA